MNRQFKKIIAIVCSLALVVCSMTVYKSTAKAETDYSGLSFEKVTAEMDSTYEYCITENSLTGYGHIGFYGNVFMMIYGSGDSKMTSNTVITIDGEPGTSPTAVVEGDANARFQVGNLTDDAYHEIS